MADQRPYCIHCGAQQLSAESRFCYQCGQPTVPVTPGRQQRPPWVGPALVSVGIILVAAIVFARLLARGPAAGQPAAATPALAAATYAQAPVKPLQSPTAPAVSPTTEGAPTREMPTPPPTETPQPTPTLVSITPEPVKLTRLAWSPDGKLLALGSGTGVYLYDTTTWQELRYISVKVSIPSQSDDAPAGLAFSFDSTMLAAAIGHAVQVWRVDDGAPAYTISGGRPLAASPTEGLWATFAPFGTYETEWAIHLWRTSDGQLVRKIPNNLLRPSTMIFSPDGQLLVVGAQHGNRPTVWRVADGQQTARLNWHEAEFYYWVTMAFRPKTTTVAAVGSIIPDSLPLLLWDASSGSVIRQLIGSSDLAAEAMIPTVKYSPDGNLLAANFWNKAGKENKVQIWNADGSVLGGWPLPGPASDIGFTPDSTLLAVVEGQRIAFYDPAAGALVREVAPEWHPGILPTPTPTPPYVGLQVPSDWLLHYNLMRFPGFRLMHPPTWRRVGDGTNTAHLSKRPASTTDAPMFVDVSVAPGLSCDPTNWVSVDSIKKMRSQTKNGDVFISGGEWPYLIPAVYAEFEKQIEPLLAEALGISGQSELHEIDLRWPYAGDTCSSASLTYSHDLSEQDRLDVSRILASIEIENETHRFPTATPTFTPTPNPLPRPTLPLQIALDTKKVGAGKDAVGQITISIMDASGVPVRAAEVKLRFESGSISRGLSDDAGVMIEYDLFFERKAVTVEIYWNQVLIAQQGFVISW